MKRGILFARLKEDKMQGMDKNEKFSKKSSSKASKNTSEGIKRIEYRGDYVRISRTGGVAGRASVSNKKIGMGCDG